jgi:hypothetical protein
MFPGIGQAAAGSKSYHGTYHQADMDVVNCLNYRRKEIWLPDAFYLPFGYHHLCHLLHHLTVIDM